MDERFRAAVMIVVGLSLAGFGGINLLLINVLGLDPAASVEIAGIAVIASALINLCVVGFVFKKD